MKNYIHVCALLREAANYAAERGDRETYVRAIARLVVLQMKAKEAQS